MAKQRPTKPAYRCKYLMRSGLVMIALGLPLTIAAQDLAIDVQIDLAIVALERALKADDHATVLMRIEQLRALDSTTTDGELLYFEAVSAHGTGDTARAEQALTRFLNTVGRQSGNYQDALALMLDLSTALEALREEEMRVQTLEQQRAAAAARAAEQAAELERQAAERTALLAQERTLDVSPADIRHIRWLLHQDRGAQSTPPHAAWLTDAERQMLAGYLSQRNMAVTDILTQNIVSYFRALPFRPQTIRSNQQPSLISGDWQVYGNGSTGTSCRIETRATAYTHGSVYVVPRMQITAQAGTSGSALSFQLALPNPFSPSSPVVANVDGQSFFTLRNDGTLSPSPLGSTTAPGLLQAVRAGQGITISGADRATGQIVTLVFSAAGFTRAFTHMAETCRRPGILDWIR